MCVLLSLAALERISNCSCVCIGYSPLPVRRDSPTSGAVNRLQPIAACAVFPTCLLRRVPLHAQGPGLVSVRCSARAFSGAAQKRSAIRSIRWLSAFPMPFVRRVPSSPSTASAPMCQRAPVRTVRLRGIPEREACVGCEHSVPDPDPIARVERESGVALEHPVSPECSGVRCRPQLLGRAPRSPPLRCDAERQSPTGGVWSVIADGPARAPLLVSGLLVRDQPSYLAFDGERPCGVAQPRAHFDPRAGFRVACVVAKANLRARSEPRPVAWLRSCACPRR